MKKYLRYICLFCCLLGTSGPLQAQHLFNAAYYGKNLDRIAFPIGGIGAGMFCLEGTGAISHFSIRNNPDLFNEPPVFAAIAVKGHPEMARVLEGPVPDWKKFGQPDAALGNPGATWGLTRFREASFLGTFPFAEISLQDQALPLAVQITGWSPFIPTDADNSSLPAGALEYHFKNTGKQKLSYVFSWNADLFSGFKQVKAIGHGFILSQAGTAEHPEDQADFAVYTDDPATIVDHTWFRSGWFDPLTMAWKHIREATPQNNPPQGDPHGATLAVPFTLAPGQEKTIVVYIAWYVPHTNLRFMQNASDPKDSTVPDASINLPSAFHMPWYSSKFKSVEEVAAYWQNNYTSLRKNSALFRDAFFNTTLPPEVKEAVSANLSILKSPTVLRQYDGRLWCWEGSSDEEGSCAGSCTHVWNYAQALSHLFPSLERSLRETEFGESQNADGHQQFRAALPIRPQSHDFYAAADGQLGGVMKVYRDWRIAGDSSWLRSLYPKVKSSLNYCIRTWDPRHTGTIEEPHHNTYDIEFWGAEGMCTGIYLGALEAMIRMGSYLHEDVSAYQALYDDGRLVMQNKLFNGQYFQQRLQWTGLSAPDPVTVSKNSLAGNYSEDALVLLKKEGPRYQYADGVLSDGVIGAWMARVCGLDAPFSPKEISSHLLSVYHYNFCADLSTHSNPQRSTYALGHEGGLLLCNWPKNDKLSLPFPYSDEVWTGIEYQVASHLIFTGHIKEGLQIVRTARQRYDSGARNPFDEYECGHWYARAMSSYALLEALTGVRYDAVNKTLYINAQTGNFTSFLSTNTGFGQVSYKNGIATLKTFYGNIKVQHTTYEKNNLSNLPLLSGSGKPLQVRN